AIAEKLDKKLQRWGAATAEEVRLRVAEIIELADDNALDLVRSKAVEQEVLDLLDEPGEVWLADLELAAKRRPVIIVSTSHSDPPRALAIYVPLTTQNRNSDYEIALPNCRSSRNFQSRMYRASLQFPQLVWSKSSVRYLDCTREIPTERGVA